MKLTVIGCGTHGNPKAVSVEFADELIVFNCGDATSRLFGDIRFINGSKINNIFVTDFSWGNVGGIYGVCLGKKENAQGGQLTIHGAKEMADILKYEGIFTEGKGFYKFIVFMDASDSPYQNSKVSVDYVPLASKKCTSAEDKDGSKSKVHKDRRCVMGYIVKFKKDRRKFKIHVLESLGIKHGPFIQEILKGNTVEMDGHTLTPEMLLEEEEPIRPLLVVDCPSEYYLDSLLEAPQYSALNDESSTVPLLIVHFTPGVIVDTPKYQSFMKRFDSKETCHLLINERAPLTVPDDRQIKRQLVMNKLHPEIFPLLHWDQTWKKQEEGRVIQGVTGLQYTLSPRRFSGFSWNFMEFTSESLLQSHFNSIKFLKESKEVMERAKKKCKELEDSSQESKEYPVITFLGTGSSAPSVYRNQSCILVETRKDEFLMLDCGLASLRQLYLMFGEKKAEEVLCNVKAIFVSHGHFDHHGGVIDIAQRRRELLDNQNRSDKIMLIIPSRMNNWFATLKEHIDNFDNLFEITQMKHFNAMQKHVFPAEIDSHVREVLTAEEFTAVPVSHVAGSFGMHMKHKDGWTLMYSGDTRPCKALVKAGYDNTDYLIHEASFQNAEIQRAVRYGHSTTEQAISIGRQMKAKHIILTHFSQRLAVQPVFEDLEEGIVFAYDFMQLKPKHIPIVTYLKPALAMLFNDGKTLKNEDYTKTLIGEIQLENLRARKRINSDSEGDAPSTKEQKLTLKTN